MSPRCAFWGVLAVCVVSGATEPHSASELGRQIQASSLDPAECYHVRDIRIQQQDVTFFLTEGYLIFGKPVNGAPVTAVFTTDLEGGDAEVVLLPPDRAERRTLSSFTASPNLDEHFTQAVFFFTDRAARELALRIHSDPSAEKAPAAGLSMADRWNVTVANLTAGFETRMVLDLMTKSPLGEGFFEAILRGRTLGDFDIVHDARASEQIAAGKLSLRDGAPVWETWTRFVERDRRNMPAPAPEEKILSYNIEAWMDASLAMRCTTRIRIRATADSRDVLPFEMDGHMRAVSAKVDGVPAEVYQHESPRDGLVQNSGNEILIVIPPQPLAVGSEHEVEIVHQGKVVQDAGDGIYSVSARGTWYPALGAQFASYDATFHYPENLDLVSAGTVRENRSENGMRTTRVVPDGRLRLLGLNLGSYTRRESERNGVTLEVSANRSFEADLRPRIPVTVAAATGPVAATHSVHLPQLSEVPALPPDPADRVDAISGEMLSAIQFFRARFGDPPIKHIEVSPVTGRYGQGFAGMIYLPTMMYLNPDDLQVRTDLRIDQAFMGQLLRVHETAHQWWGNIVTTDSYHHEWLMESLANYSAVMYLENGMGPKAVEKALDRYRVDLLAKGPDGATAESRGPVVEGRRLQSSVAPNAGDAVLYGKGTWIIHMLRRRLGDADFMKMLAELRRRYEWKTITTDEFRQLCAEFMPAGSGDPKLVDFFDQWVYDTGMPTLKLTYSVSGDGRRLTGTITQTDVRGDFSVMVPVEIRAGGGKPVVKMVRTANEPVKFSVDVAGPGVKAVLDPGWSVLRR